MTGQYYKRDFWGVENRKYAAPGFRMLRASRIIRGLARAANKPCDLLDVGCGPAALARLTGPDVRYHGIDIAIAEPAPNLREMDFLETPIAFDGKTFDIAVALGVFEYVGEFQQRKFAEIAALLKPGGTFLVSYVNFGHWKRSIYWLYSNVRPIAEFRTGLGQHFSVRRQFPVGHNWNHIEPNRRWLQAAQLSHDVSVPMFSPVFAVEYFFVCGGRG